MPSMRMIIDMSDFRNNLSIHTTGQSGHPASANYTDMVDAWATIQYNPMLWYREDIEASATGTLTLQPVE